MRKPSQMYPFVEKRLMKFNKWFNNPERKEKISLLKLITIKT